MGPEAARADDFELGQYLHLHALNRGVLLTPFHNMALMSPGDHHRGCHGAYCSFLGSSGKLGRVNDTIFASNTPARRVEGMLKARMAVGRGEVVCIPTDTRYALVVNAFKVSALEKLRTVRNMRGGAPLSVLIPGIPTLSALAGEVHPEVLSLAKEFWPGALTLIVHAGESIAWDLGATGGSVALRMPADRVAAELLSETGPLAHSGAFRVGEKAPHVTPGHCEKVRIRRIRVPLRGRGETWENPVNRG